jgi:mono/diheme cytochrome c family protein
MAAILSGVTAVHAAAPTFSKDVAPIFFQRCVQCHRPDDVAPMSLLDYKSARPWAKAIREAVATRKMPPWFADPAYGHFSNDPRLTDREIQIVRSWVDGGAPEGNPKDLPAAPKFNEGWRLGKPDIIIDIGEDYVVKPGNDSYETSS